jgi:hypothetical protein
MAGYLILYVATLAAGGIVARAIMARAGIGLFSWLFGVGWVAIVVWGYVGGRACVRRDALVEALRDLEGS